MSDFWVCEDCGFARAVPPRECSVQAVVYDSCPERTMKRLASYLEPGSKACKRPAAHPLRGGTCARDCDEYSRWQRQAYRRLSLSKLSQEVKPVASVNRLGRYVSRGNHTYDRQIILEVCRSYRQLLSRVSESDSVCDLGGNIGVFAVEAALRGAAAVRTYEPERSNFARLRLM